MQIIIHEQLELAKFIRKPGKAINSLFTERRMQSDLRRSCWSCFRNTIDIYE